MFCYGKHAVLQVLCRSLITGQSGLLHICRNCGFASHKLLPQKYNRLGKAASIDKAVKIIQEYVDTLKLNEYLYEFRTSKWKYKTERTVFNVVPHVSSLKTNDDGTIVQYKEGFFLYIKNNRDKCQVLRPTFRCYNNQLYMSALYIFNLAKIPNWETEKQTSVKSADELQTLSKRLLERWDGLVKLPNEQLWNEWQNSKPNPRKKRAR